MRNPLHLITLACLLLGGHALVYGAKKAPKETVATFMWMRVGEADSLAQGYRVVHEGSKTKYVIPSTGLIVPGEMKVYNSFHGHGVIAESSLAAYRIYFDEKQTIDLYLKRRPRMEIDACTWYPNDAQLADGFGDDVLRVSSTVGVGTVRSWNGQKPANITPVAFRGQRIVRCDKKGAQIEAVVRGWETEGKKVDMAVRYTLRPGHRDMDCEVLTTEPLDSLCTGVQLHPDAEMLASPRKKGLLLGSWGTDWPVNDTVKYGKETVGLGVFIPKAYAGEIRKDKRNLCALLRMKKCKAQPQAQKASVLEEAPAPYRYRACFRLTATGLKEDCPAAHSHREFLEEYLPQWADKK